MTDADFRPVKVDAKGMTSADILKVIEVDKPKPQETSFKRRF